METANHLFRKLNGYFADREEIRRQISALCSQRVEFPPGRYLARQGYSYDRIFLLESGWVLRSKTLKDGGRQIVNLGLPGDFLCFNATMFEKSDYDLVARTDISAFRLEVRDFESLLGEHTDLAVVLAWTTAMEEAVLAERVASLGRRAAAERLAHILCELEARLEALGLVEEQALTIPLTQEEFADILGISPIHVNRSLRKLQKDGLIDYRLGKIFIPDANKLREFAGFDDGYLHFARSDFKRRA